MKQVREGLKPVYPKWVLNYISSIQPFNQVVIADVQLWRGLHGGTVEPALTGG